jgi:chromosome segregation ATPase
MIFRRIVASGSSFRNSLDATGQAVQRCLWAMAGILAALNRILTALLDIQRILASLERAIRALSLALRRLNAGPPPLIAIATLVRQLLLAVRRVIRTIRQALENALRQVREVQVTLTALRILLQQVANRVDLVRPELQALIEVAAALEPQQEALEPLLPEAVKARILALVADIDAITRQLDALRSNLDGNAAALEHIAAALEATADEIGARARALQAATSTIQSVADALADLVDFVEQTLRNIPVVGMLLDLLSAIGETIDNVIQAFLDATGISALIRDAIDAVTGFGKLVDQLAQAAAQALQLDHIQKVISAIASELSNLLHRVLQPVRDLLATLRGLALFKLLSEFLLAQVLDEIPRIERQLEEGKVDPDKATERIAELAQTVSDAAATHPVPLMQVEALASIRSVIEELQAAADQLRGGAMQEAHEQLSSALENARRGRVMDAPPGLDQEYFARLAELTGIRISRGD